MGPNKSQRKGKSPTILTMPKPTNNSTIWSNLPRHSPHLSFFPHVLRKSLVWWLLYFFVFFWHSFEILLRSPCAGHRKMAPAHKRPYGGYSKSLPPRSAPVAPDARDLACLRCTKRLATKINHQCVKNPGSRVPALKLHNTTYPINLSSTSDQGLRSPWPDQYSQEKERRNTFDVASSYSSA